MLRGIRNASSGWLGKTIMAAVVGFLVISFGVWGIGDIFRGYTRGALATVGNTKMSADQFRQLFNARIQALSRQVRRPISPDQARAFGIDRQVHPNGSKTPRSTSTRNACGSAFPRPTWSSRS